MVHRASLNVIANVKSLLLQELSLAEFVAQSVCVNVWLAYLNATSVRVMMLVDIRYILKRFRYVVDTLKNS